MSEEWTVELPLGGEDALHVDLVGLSVEGYRVVPEDWVSPQTVVHGIEEAISYASPEMTAVERLEKTSELSASLSDELKARVMEVQSDPWIYNRKPNEEELKNSTHVWCWFPGAGKAIASIAGEYGRHLMHGQAWAPITGPRPTTAPNYDR